MASIPAIRIIAISAILARHAAPDANSGACRVGGLARPGAGGARVSGAPGGTAARAPPGTGAGKSSHDSDTPGHLWRKSGIFAVILS